MNTKLLALLCALFLSAEASALVKYDEGRITLNGVQLLQDSENPKEYYYLPQYPRLAQRDDGSYEIMCIKYVGTGGPETNGGLFHALVEFTLPPEVVDELQSELERQIPNARIVGPVPMQENMKDGEDGMASFEVVSSILRNVEGENPLTQNFITSGHAPLLPNSRAAIAARLSQEGATLLWSSFQGATSDVSIAIRGYYEAMVKGYNAVITAEVSTVYKHFSQVQYQAEGYTMDQLRDITDKLIQEQKINVEVFDRSDGLGIKADDMQGIVDLVTNKLIELMFDSKTGWAKTPKPVTAVEQNQIPGRQERGAFVKFFAGDGNPEYITDSQFVLKRVKNIRVNKFYLNLSKSTSIKVPFFTTGNIRGFYDAHQENEEYFQIVNLDDPDFAKREILFQVDGEFAQAFGDILNFVTVGFQKKYPSQPAVTGEIVIKGSDLTEGLDLKGLTYPALGLNGDDLIDYNYRISWSFKGDEKTIHIPPREGDWLTGRDAAVSLRPPFEKRLIEVDADRAMIKESGYRSATVRFFTVLNGQPKVQRTVILRNSDAQNTDKIALYHDEGKPCAYQVNWYSEKSGEAVEGEVLEITDNYLFLAPPE